MKELPEGYLSGMNVNYGAGGIFSNKHIHWRGMNIICPHNKFYYITSGSCILQENGISYEASAGMWFLIPAGMRHSFYAKEGVTFQKYWLHFNLETGGNNFFSLVKLPRYLVIGDDKQVKKQFKTVFQYAEDDSLYGILKLKVAILDLVAAYIERTAHYEIAPREETEAEIGSVFAYINEHINRPISNAELAAVAGMHPNYFIRLFKEKTGTTPAKHITIQRIERAKTLLETTDLPISDIMHSLGFDDISHFSKLFKRYAGYSPRYYREYYLKQEVYEN